MSYQYRTSTRGDHKNSCAHDWRARKEEITHRFKLEDLKFDGYPDPSIFSNWYRFLKATRILFTRRKLVGIVKVHWDSIMRDCIRHGVAIKSWAEIKEKLKEKYLPEYYRNRLLDQLHNLRPRDISVQDYIAKFEDLTLCCDVRALFSYRN